MSPIGRYIAYIPSNAMSSPFEDTSILVRLGRIIGVGNLETKSEVPNQEDKYKYRIGFHDIEDFDLTTMKRWDWFGRAVVMVREWKGKMDVVEDVIETIPI